MRCENETADAIIDELKMAIMDSPLDPGGTKASLYSFWDNNIRKILVRCLKNAESIRNSDRSTETGLLRPDFGLLLANVFVFRGEEKGMTFTGKHPKYERPDGRMSRPVIFSVGSPSCLSNFSVVHIFRI